MPVKSSAFGGGDELRVNVALFERQVGGVTVGEDPGKFVYIPDGEQDVGCQVVRVEDYVG